jgi:hypothetical protein
MMSTFNETITLTNARDEINARTGLIPASQVHRLTVDARVDTGTRLLVINEKVRAALALELTGTARVERADGSIMEYPLTGAVEFRWKDRKKSMGALLIPDADAVVFGKMCMDALDLIPDPEAKCLKGRHGDKAVYPVYKLKQSPCAGNPPRKEDSPINCL